MGSYSLGVTWLQAGLTIASAPREGMCQVPEIKNDRVYLNINLPLASKFSRVEVYLGISCSSSCRPARGKVRIPTLPNADRLHVSK